MERALWEKQEAIVRALYWCIEGARSTPEQDGVWVDVRVEDDAKLTRLDEGYQSGNMTVSPEDAALVAEYLGLERLEDVRSRLVLMPASVTSFNDVIKLLAQRVKARKQIPSWVPPHLHMALPGSEDWDIDRPACDDMIVARVCRLASGALVDNCGTVAGFHIRTAAVPLRYQASGFVGRLIIRRQAQRRDEYLSPWSKPEDFSWIGLERLADSSVSDTASRDSFVSWSPSGPRQCYELPVTDRARFWRLTWEFTKPLSGV